MKTTVQKLGTYKCGAMHIQFVTLNFGKAHSILKKKMSIFVLFARLKIPVKFESVNIDQGLRYCSFKKAEKYSAGSCSWFFYIDREHSRHCNTSSVQSIGECSRVGRHTKW